MVNYILGARWKNEFITFYLMTGSAALYTYTFTDTPQLGGTEGLRRDKKISEQIKEFFSIPRPDGIDHLDAIDFVV